LLDTAIKVQHPCPFCDLSVAFPEAKMAVWCNRTLEVMQIEAPQDEALEAVLEAAKESLHVYDVFQDGRFALTMARKCECQSYRSITSVADEHGVWHVPPITYYDGWETHRIISSGKRPLQRFVADIRTDGRVQVLSHHPRERLDPIHHLGLAPVRLFEGLTGKQVRSLVLAYERGLFELPARERMDHVAEGIGVARSTFGEHLRKAQLRLLRNSYPFLKLREQA
ncbi:MAG: helix-turn-helix domain-containing protein, partial [Thermoplasmata archaeon]|nr:helix-turn-helix domain-containing protein [Thermoplasmata archaeon]